MESQPTTQPRQSRSLVKSISLTFAGQGGMLLATVLLSSVAAHLLGPGGKGELNTAVITAGVLGLLTELGLRASVIRLIASGRLNWKEGVGTMVTLYGAVCLVTLPLAILFFNAYHQRFFPGIPLFVFHLALLGVPFSLLEGSLTSALIGLQRMPEVSGIWLTERVGAVCGLLLFVWAMGFGVAGAVVAQLFGTVVGICVALVLLARHQSGEARLRVDLLPGLLKFGGAWYLRNLATSLNYRFDALLVYSFNGAVAAGLYSAAVSSAELLQYLPNSIDAVLFPHVSQGATNAVEERTARLSRFTVLVTLVGGLVIAAIGYPAIWLLFGKSFTAGYPALLLLLPGMLVLGQSKVIFSEMLGRGYAKFPAIASWVALGATLLLDFLLIPQWGILGAAVASTVAYTVSSAMGVYYYHKLTGMSVRALYGLRAGEVRDILRRVRAKFGSG